MSAAESEFGRALRNLYEEANRAWNEGDFERAYQVLGDDIEYELASTWPQSRPRFPTYGPDPLISSRSASAA